MNIILLGPPASGKGTQSKLLENELNFQHISTGDLLRERRKKQDDLGKYISNQIDNGLFVSDEIMLTILKERLIDQKDTVNFIFDGYPRNYEQAIIFDELMVQLGRKIDLVINLNINREEIIKRISDRRVCQCGASYHLVNNRPAIDNVCDYCGSTLYQREDDNPKSILIRIDTYEKLTAPLINYYKKKNIIKNIDALLSIEQVFELIKEQIEVIK